MIAIATTAVLFTMVGYGLCAMMTVSKRSDVNIIKDCTIEKCNKSCKGWDVCDKTWHDVP